MTEILVEMTTMREKMINNNQGRGDGDTTTECEHEIRETERRSDSLRRHKISSIVRAASPSPIMLSTQHGRHKSAQAADAFIGLWEEACHPHTANITPPLAVSLSPSHTRLQMHSHSYLKAHTQPHRILMLRYNTQGPLS